MKTSLDFVNQILISKNQQLQTKAQQLNLYLQTFTVVAIVLWLFKLMATYFPNQKVKTKRKFAVCSDDGKVISPVFPRSFFAIDIDATSFVAVAPNISSELEKIQQVNIGRWLESVKYAHDKYPPKDPMAECEGFSNCFGEPRSRY